MTKGCNGCFGAAGDDCQRCQEVDEVTSPKLDITPELAISAISVVKQYAKGVSCSDCAYRGEICENFLKCPQFWPKTEQKQGGNTNVQKQ